MSIDEAVKIMNTFIKAYEHAQKAESMDKLLHIKSDYEATRVVLKELAKLEREVQKWKKEAKYYEDVANQQTREKYGIE